MPRHLFILNLHGVGAAKREVPATERSVWIDGARFEAILEYAKARNDIELTFDDSNESDYTVALPALQARGMKAQFFLVAQRIGQPSYLSASQVKSLLAAGMEIGNHGMRHRPWARLDKSELQEELVGARNQLEQLTGVRIDRASCPFGSYNRRVIRALRSAGYKHIYTSDGGPAMPGTFLISRNTVHREHDLGKIKAIIFGRPSYARQFYKYFKLVMKRWL